MEYSISAYEQAALDELLPLYAAVGWTNYTARPEMLHMAYERSLCTLAAYDGDRLIGVIRAVGDGCSIVFVQDLLVDPSYHRRGIGSALLTAMKERFPRVYQMELMTENTVQSRRFYEVNGFREASEIGCLAYIRQE